MVYGEWVLILNFLVDGVLLRITGRLWGYPAPWGRWALASALGAVGALFALCGPSLDGWLDNEGRASGPDGAGLLAPGAPPACFPGRHVDGGSAVGRRWGAGPDAAAARPVYAWLGRIAGGLTITLLLSAWTLVPRQLHPYRRTVCCRAVGCRFWARVDTGNGLTEPVSGCRLFYYHPARLSASLASARRC